MKTLRLDPILKKVKRIRHVATNTYLQFYKSSSKCTTWKLNSNKMISALFTATKAESILAQLGEKYPDQFEIS